jgi:hypothetical protein
MGVTMIYVLGLVITIISCTNKINCAICKNRRHSNIKNFLKKKLKSLIKTQKIFQKIIQKQF